MRIRRLSLIVGLMALLVGLPGAPASARWGVPFSVDVSVHSGGSDWVSLGDVTTVTRQVRPGHGVSFDVVASADGQPSQDPLAFGCASSDGIEVRYVLEARRRDRDVTDAMVGTGWTRQSSMRWNVRIRVAFRVDSSVALGTTLSCRVAFNKQPVRAVVTVR
jgi:hypothetical protein